MNISFLDSTVTERVNILLKETNYDWNKAFCLAAKYRDPDVIEYMLKYKETDPFYNDRCALREAIENNDPHTVEILLIRVAATPTMFLTAIQKNYSKVVSILMKDKDMYINNEILYIAIENNYYDIVFLLLDDIYSRVNPAADNNKAICLASTYGHLESLIILLEDDRTNPIFLTRTVYRKTISKDVYTDALKCSLKDFDNVDTVKILLDDLRVDPNNSVKTAIEKGYQKSLEILLADFRTNLEVLDTKYKILGNQLRKNKLLTLLDITSLSSLEINKIVGHSNGNKYERVIEVIRIFDVLNIIDIYTKNILLDDIFLNSFVLDNNSLSDILNDLNIRYIPHITHTTASLLISYKIGYMKNNAYKLLKMMTPYSTQKIINYL